MRKLIILLLTILSLTSCASDSKDTGVKSIPVGNEMYEDILNQAESQASLGGKKILEISRSMIAAQEIIIGGCWNYINTVFDRAGYTKALRETAFKSKLKGPYVKDEAILPGDWLYFVNHSYGETEHSAIFVAWTDEEKKEALMVSYEGEGRKKPAIYKKYILTHIYNIIRSRE